MVRTICSSRRSETLSISVIPPTQQDSSGTIQDEDNPIPPSSQLRPSTSTPLEPRQPSGPIDSFPEEDYATTHGSPTDPEDLNAQLAELCRLINEALV